MAGISMCANPRCPLQATCYRATATPGVWQSYGAYAPVDGVCTSFLPLEPNSAPLAPVSPHLAAAVAPDDDRGTLDATSLA